MNFNLDDPLAGILSDGSDDSFFDDDISKKKPPKRSETSIADKKSAIFDLGDKKSQSNHPNDDNLLGEKKNPKEPVVEDQPTTDNLKSISPTPFKKTNSKEPLLAATKSPHKPKFDLSTDNILNDFGLQPKKDTVKILEKGKSSQSLLDDILGSSKKTSTQQTTKPTTATKKQSYDLDSFLDTESRPTTSTAKVATQKSTTKSESVKEVSQSKKKSGDDWLGIFQASENIMEEDEEEDDVPAWLGGGGSKKKKNVKEAITESHQKEEVPKEKPKTDVDTQKESNNLDHVVQNVVTNIPSMEVNQEDITMQGTALYLQQQESQLMVALQLKAQDEKLAAMQSKTTT